VAGDFKKNGLRDRRDAGNGVAETLINWLKFGPNVDDAELGEFAASLLQKVLSSLDHAAAKSALLAVRFDRQQAEIASARILDLHVNTTEQLRSLFKQQEFPGFQKRAQFFSSDAIAVDDGFFDDERCVDQTDECVGIGGFC
jgi:hypothetical protein